MLFKIKKVAKIDRNLSATSIQIAATISARNFGSPITECSGIANNAVVSVAKLKPNRIHVIQEFRIPPINANKKEASIAFHSEQNTFLFDRYAARTP